MGLKLKYFRIDFYLIGGKIYENNMKEKHIFTRLSEYLENASH